LLSESVKKKILDYADSLKCPIMIRDGEFIEIGEHDITLFFSDGLKFLYAFDVVPIVKDGTIQLKTRLLCTKTNPGAIPK